MAAPKVFINPAAVAALTAPGGLVFEHVATFVRRTEAEAKQNAPVDTGNLRASIGSTITHDHNGVEGRVGSDVNYLLPVHEGSRPHDIRPRNAKALRFKGSRPGRKTKKGGYIFASVVHHPGNRANPFLYEAAVTVNDQGGFGFIITRAG